MLCNLVLHRAFKDEYPEIRIGLSKFAESRPKHCVLAGASGMHSVCVCTIHQNVKLMIHGVKLIELTTSDGVSYPTYEDCIANAICNPPQPKCYLRTCTECPGLDGLKEFLHTALDENMIDTITYKQWVSVDRCTPAAHQTSLWKPSLIRWKHSFHIRSLQNSSPHTSMSVRQL